MTRKPYIALLLLFFFTFSCLSACSGGGDVPAQTVELYYQALVDKDQERLLTLSCAKEESMALLEFDSFQNVDASLEEVTCQSISQEGESARVTCQGDIAASYDGEIRAFPLGGKTYLVVKEAGEWRVCGFE